MNEYRVSWQLQPHCNHPRRVNFVMAESENNARAVIIDYIERTVGMGMKTIHSVEQYEKPTVGYVIK